MTHEHMDHVQGLLRAHANGEQLPVIEHAWLTASAEEDYYERFPDAATQRARHLAAYERVKEIANQRGLSAAPVKAFLENNNPNHTAHCVAFLRSLARRHTSYVHRGFVPSAKHRPFREAKFSVWAPERDTTAYYGRLRPVMKASKRRIAAPYGVDQGAFDALLTFARSGLGDEMLSIDRAANNTSVVFELEWRGWRLLFSGDAETKSWDTMVRHDQVRPVHFVKVGHHASHNGTPGEHVLDRLLPRTRPDGRPRTALVSTCAGTYNGVPDHDTLARLARRVDEMVYTNDVPVGSAVEIRFEGSA
jgi:hypothetical protein